MKKFFTLVFIISSLFFLSACASDEEIADELLDYYNNEWIPNHVKKEREAGAAKKAVFNIPTEIDEKQAKEVIVLLEEDVIPVADNLIDRYESLQLEHRDVKKLNKMQIKVE